MATLILLSTSSFAVQQHFCGDALIDSTVFSPLEKCSDAPCSNPLNIPLMAQPDCCSDVVDVVEGRKFVVHKLSVHKYNHPLSEPALAEASFSSSSFKELSAQVVPHKSYTPPTLVADVHVANQVFLI
uniref:HYC_CC_PP family protein n=1 Tax=Marixanthomonas spongiae TaxID=2174845 RepID=UPI00197D77DB|nr:hypothetical protein [Marixanthomonas spongiae]